MKRVLKDPMGNIGDSIVEEKKNYIGRSICRAAPELIEQGLFSKSSTEENVVKVAVRGRG